MAAPKYLTWDGDPTASPIAIAARRPSVTDVDSDTLQDGTVAPIPGVHPTADGHNQRSKQIPALSKMVWAASVEVTVSGGTPVVTRVNAPSTVLTTTDFQLTDNAPGDTTVTLLNLAKMPPAQEAPEAHRLGNVGGGSATSEVVTTGVWRVRTYNAAGTLTDNISFKLKISGL